MTAENAKRPPVLALDTSLEDARLDGERVWLTSNEYRVLEHLASKPGTAFSRVTLARGLGTQDVRTVDTHVKNIRAKLHENARRPYWLKTVHGIGYRLDLPDAPGERIQDNLSDSGRIFRSAGGDATLEISEERHRIILNGVDISPTTSEYQVLLALIHHAGEAIDKEALSEEALGIGFLASGRLLASHIKNLRKKLDDPARNPRWIATIHGFGFRFVGEEETSPQVAEDPRAAELAQAAQQLADYLSMSNGNIVIWNDPNCLWHENLLRIELPKDVTILSEDPRSRFALLEKLYDAAPDEQIVLHRTRRSRIEQDDWLADIEAYAEHFAPDFSPSHEAPHQPDEASEDKTHGPHSIPDADIARIKEGLTSDWYTPQGFQLAVKALCDNNGLFDAAEPEPWQLGFRSCGDCVLRSSWRTPDAYYRTLFSHALVTEESIPQDMRQTFTFIQFVNSSIMKGAFYPYDDSTFITPAGLTELEITPSDMDAFARDAAKRGIESGVPQFTVPWLRINAADLPLLAYGLSDAFYESVLLSRKRYCTRGHLGGRRIFAEPHTQARGRDLIASLLTHEASLDIDELLDILREAYGIDITISQLVTLIRKTSLFYSPELDRVYASHDQFIREVE